MMHARTRRELVNEMMTEYDEELVHSLVDAIVAHTNKSCGESVEIVLEAWQHAKHHTLEEAVEELQRRKVDINLN